jgi:hypothetical protein
MSMRSVVLCFRPDISYKNAAHKHDLSRLAKAKAKASNEFHSDFPEPASGQTARRASFPSHAATRAAFIKCALEVSHRNTAISASQYFDNLLQ